MIPGFSKTRTEAADMLGVSTRTIDRHIKSNKIRTQKSGKVIYLNDDDIASLGQGNYTQSPNQDYEILEDGTQVVHTENASNLPATLSKQDLIAIFEPLQKSLEQKDAMIQDLSFKLGKTEEQLNHSISVEDHKKKTQILTQAHQKTQDENEQLKEAIVQRLTAMKKQNVVNVILVVCLFILFIVSIISIYVAYIR